MISTIEDIIKLNRLTHETYGVTEEDVLKINNLQTMLVKRAENQTCPSDGDAIIIYKDGDILCSKSRIGSHPRNSWSHDTVTMTCLSPPFIYDVEKEIRVSISAGHSFRMFKEPKFISVTQKKFRIQLECKILVFEASVKLFSFTNKLLK